MKRIVVISLMVMAVLGLTQHKVQAEWVNWNVSITIANSAEVPVVISLENNDQANAKFKNGSSSCTVQPGQSNVVTGTVTSPFIKTVEWNIIYNFYDGTPSINQRVSSSYGPQNNGVSSSYQSGLFNASASTYVDTSWTELNIGQGIASSMHLSGVAAKIVAGLIDLGMDWAGIPDSSDNLYYNYSTTISQQDYNLDKLAGVNWFFSNKGIPSIAFIQGQEVYEFLSTDLSWQSAQALPGNSTTAKFDCFRNSLNIISVGTSTGQITTYNLSDPAPQSAKELYFGNNQSVVQLSRNPAADQYAAAFSDSSVHYFDGTNNHLLQSSGWDSAILQMSVNWVGNSPQVIVGLADGAVEYYNGNAWTELHNTGWATSIMQLSAYWDSNNKLQVVVGLGDGAVEYWNGSGWTELQNTGWSNPIYQLKAQFWDNQQPNVLVTLFDGAIFSYMPASGWTQVRTNDNMYCIIDMAPQVKTATGYTPPPFPTFMAGYKDGSVSLFLGGKEYPLQHSTGYRVQFISANWDDPYWDNGYSPEKSSYVYSQNYQFILGYGNSVAYQYPAIPSTSSACGDIDGDGKGDLISVEGSNWYIWYSSNQYSTRYGPYDRGVYGKPVIGDIDGDGQGDLIMVNGSHWYIWSSSSGYSMRYDWDLGILGNPLTADIDGDGQDDAIMVMGSLWYVWTSSSGYNKRLGPYDLGIHGQSASGDIDGDGLGDFVVTIGSDWYMWSAATQYQLRFGPYNMEISGIPKIADIDGDKLADLIVVLGTDWYVRFSTSGYQLLGPFTMSLP